MRPDRRHLAAGRCRPRRRRLPIRTGPPDARPLRRRAAAAGAGRHAGAAARPAHARRADGEPRPRGRGRAARRPRPGARAARRDAHPGRAPRRRVAAARRPGRRHRGGRRRRRRWSAARRLPRARRRAWPMPACGCRTTRRAPRRAATARVRQTLVIAEHAAFRYPGAADDAVASVDLTVRSSEALPSSVRTAAASRRWRCCSPACCAPRVGRVVAGEALAAGRGHEPIAGWPARDLARRIGTVFQDPEHQFLTASVRDELLLGPRRRPAWTRPPPAPGRRAARPPAAVAPRRSQPVHALRRREAPAVGRDRARDGAALLVLDEPTFGQDRAHVERAAPPARRAARRRARHLLRHP